MKRSYILYTLLLVLNFSLTNAQTGGDAIIYTEQYIGEKIEYFFYDIKQNLNGINNKDKARDLYVDDDMNGIRVSILGNDKNNMRAHPQAGVVVAEYYTPMINSIKNAREARGGKDFYIFASKKLTSETDGFSSFPAWTKDANGVMVNEYATMLGDYLRYMKYKDCEVDYLGIQNEEVYNEGNITAAKHADIIDKLRILSAEQGWKMPLIVGYEDYGPNKAVISGKGSFISNLSKLGKTDRMDIYGTHYYPQWRPLSKLQKDQSFLGHMPFWSTEPHWDRKSDVNDFDEAIPAIMTLWDQVEQRMSGFMWWNYTYYSTTEMRSNLMRAFSAPIKDKQAIRMDDIDGPFRKGVKDYNDLETYAFRSNDEMIVYVLNNTDKEYVNYGFKIDKGCIQSSILGRRWVKDGDALGVEGSFPKANDQLFNANIVANSINAFSFKFDDGSSAIEDQVATQGLKVYPSVASDFIYLQNNNTPYTIYNINGKVTNSGSEKKISICTYPKGIYILKNAKGEMARFIKK